ncbi:MAG: hypothetical protein HY291_04400 [Planctomycetes bacterium]|nr:hypothetical protein [Planctomycetota bacterium]
MTMLKTTLAAAGLALALSSGASALEDDAAIAVLVHRDGVVRGIILKETEQEVVIRTYVGDKTFTKDQIVELRTNLTAQERAAILARVNPSKDDDAAKARDAAIAAGNAKAAETPKAEVAAKQDKPAPAAELAGIARNPYIGDRPQSFATNAATWEERMLAGLDRKLTLELVDDDFCEALELVSSMTNINIVISPKVRELKPRVSLNVKSMDAANVLKWMTKLTDTHIEIHEGALYITDKPSKEAADTERTELLLALTRMGADTNVLPPDGQEITEADRMKVAMAIFEKENPKPTDFPGPRPGAFNSDPDSNPAVNPFQP